MSSAANEASNIVPVSPKHLKGLRRTSREPPQHPQHHHQHHHHHHDKAGTELPRGFLDATPEGASPDPRAFLLFDLNGTLTSHTAQRRSAGVNRMRPCLEQLWRLTPYFRIGIFTSSSDRTVATVLPMLEAAAQPSSTTSSEGSGSGAAAGSPKAKAPVLQRLFCEPQLVLTRRSTVAAPAHHVANGGKPWDTVKPLAVRFQNMGRVLLVDDDAFKAVAGEEPNMVIMPCWRDDDDEDTCVAALVDALLESVPTAGPDADLRLLAPAVTARLAAHHHARKGTPAHDVNGLVIGESVIPAEEAAAGLVGMVRVAAADDAEIPLDAESEQGGRRAGGANGAADEAEIALDEDRDGSVATAAAAEGSCAAAAGIARDAAEISLDAEDGDATSNGGVATCGSAGADAAGPAIGESLQDLGIQRGSTGNRTSKSENRVWVSGQEDSLLVKLPAVSSQEAEHDVELAGQKPLAAV